MYIYLKYGNTNNGDLTMNRKIIVMIIILLLSLIVGVIIYKNITKKENIVGLNETTQNIMEISLKEERKSLFSFVLCSFFRTFGGQKST